MHAFSYLGLVAVIVGMSACATDDRATTATTLAPAATAPVAANPRAELVVADQRPRGRTIVVRRVQLDVDGFVVVRQSNADGSPAASPALGYTDVIRGTTANVVVRLNRPVRRGTRLIATVHYDTGKMGVFEYGPGKADDQPASRDGRPLMRSFIVR